MSGDGLCVKVTDAVAESLVMMRMMVMTIHVEFHGE
jgi:hypothetical protein